MALQLTAYYTAPTYNSRAFSSPLPALSASPGISNRTAFLKALIGEDNVASGKLAGEEAKEEDNYREEFVEDE
ncbi:hypothetical protein K432DRAFT_409768 [Lepidopterella palustris CBS 459.81]|uniref:EKC/KEOPS complex subunit GON7 n=1 Tax=Lepidopterella palustris CBS 459.81 TaxID=1314670 RepID=A0A8E2DZH1_9PEZI|nr:hypothetical protein K432DRAFT_409768 [Lepidopterella palustris CBS 459.81]